MRVAVAIPAFNEADGIGGFLAELDRALASVADAHAFVVVDDGSTDDTAAVVASLGSSLAGDLVLERMETNRGHGPTVLTAYGRALDLAPDIVCQVDGDGQFEAEDLVLLVEAVERGASVATGRRHTRADPWYRRLISRILAVLLRVGFGVDRSDANCPLRCYRSAVLRQFLEEVPSDASIPHVLLTVVEDRSGEPTVEVDVRHRVRRGAGATGSTWGSARRGVPVRLLRFCWDALRELRRFRRGLA